MSKEIRIEEIQTKMVRLLALIKSSKEDFEIITHTIENMKKEPEYLK